MQASLALADVSLVRLLLGTKGGEVLFGRVRGIRHELLSGGAGTIKESLRQPGRACNHADRVTLRPLGTLQARRVADPAT